MEKIIQSILKEFWVQKYFSNQDLQKFLWITNIYPILNYLLEQNRIIKIKQWEYYILSPGEENICQHPFFFLRFLGKNEYIPAYWTALTYYDLLEQFFMKNIVITNEKYDNSNTEIQWISFYKVKNPFNEKFWITKIRIDWRAYEITDIERTFLDCFDKPHLSMWIQEVAKAFYEAIEEKSIDFDKLLFYLKKYKSKIKIARRLGFILEKFNILYEIKVKNWYLVDELKKISNWSTQYMYLETINNKKKNIQYIWDPNWKLYYNQYINFLSLIQY